jgi:hypothetical protein
MLNVFLARICRCLPVAATASLTPHSIALGYLYPMYKSFKILKENDAEKLKKMLSFWSFPPPPPPPSQPPHHLGLSSAASHAQKPSQTPLRSGSRSTTKPRSPSTCGSSKTTSNSPPPPPQVYTPRVLTQSSAPSSSQSCRSTRSSLTNRSSTRSKSSTSPPPSCPLKRAGPHFAVLRRRVLDREGARGGDDRTRGGGGAAKALTNQAHSFLLDAIAKQNQRRAQQGGGHMDPKVD